MNQHVRYLAVAVAVCLGVTASVDTSSALAADAMTGLSGCVAKADNLSVLVMVDTSRSLSDLQRDERDQGIKALIGGLGQSVSAENALRQARRDTGHSPNRLNASIQIAGFNNAAIPGVWRRGVDVDHLEEALQDVDAIGANKGDNTDYRAAMNYAYAQLSSRSVGSAGCSALVFFTDGKYEVPKHRRDPIAEVKRGQAYLCRSGGLMDQMQRAGIYRFTVGLGDPSRFGLIRAMTIGRARAGGCGAVIAGRDGFFVRSGDNSLFVDFAALLSPGGSAISSQSPRFVRIVPGISEFSIIADAPAGEVEIRDPMASGPGDKSNLIRIRFPDGKDASDGVQKGSGRLGPSDVSYAWFSDTGVRITVKVPVGRSGRDAAAFGDWVYSIPTVGGKPPFSRYIRRAAVRPMLVSAAKVYRGEENRILVDLAAVGDAPDEVRSVLESPLVANAGVTASMVDPYSSREYPVDVERGPKAGSFVLSTEVPAELESSALKLSVVPSFKVDDSVSLASDPLLVELPVEFPANKGLPTVTPSSIRLATIEGAGSASGSFRLAASRNHGATVCFSAPAFDGVHGPGDPASYRVTIDLPGAGNDRCRYLKAGKSITVPVRLATTDSASGLVTVAVPLTFRNELVSTPAKQTVTLTAPLIAERHGVLRTLLVVLLALMGGVLVPAFMLHLLNRRNASFIGVGPAVFVSLDVTVTDQGLVGATGRNPEVTILSAEPFNPERKVEGLAFGVSASGSFKDRTLGLLRILRGPFGFVRPPADLAAITGSRAVGRLDQKLGRGLVEFPLVLDRAWAFVYSPSSVGAANAPRESAAGDDLNAEDLDGLLDDFADEMATEQASAEGAPSSSEGPVTVAGRLIVISTSPDAEPLNDTIADAGRRLAATDWVKKIQKSSGGAAGAPKRASVDGSPSEVRRRSSAYVADGSEVEQTRSEAPSGKEPDLVDELEDLLD